MTDPRLAISSQWGSSDGTPLLEVLDSVRPIIRIDQGAGNTAANAAASLFSMLVRVYPHTEIDGDASLGSNPWGVSMLSELSGALLSSRPTPVRDPGRTIVLGVGAGVTSADLWIGGGDWTSRVGRSPQPIVPGGIGLGLQAAAAQAAAEIMKLVLGNRMVHVSISETIVWNLYDHTLSELEVPVGDLSPVRLGFLGAGSVGSSTVALATMIDELQGRTDIVDPDDFDPRRNPYRYPASLGNETGPKAQWLASLLKSRGWMAESHVTTVGRWAADQSQPGFDGIAISSVDSVEGRLEVADLLARTTLTLGVAGLALHVQREHLGDGLACPFCQYVSLNSAVSQLQVWATLTGIPLDRIATLHLNHQGLSQGDIELAINAGRLAAEGSADLVGRRLEDLIHRAYAEATVQLPSGAAADVSAPYVSWMAGVLAVAEIIKSAAGLPLIDRRFDLDMSGVPLGIVRRRAADNSGRCICRPGIRSRWANKLYGGTWNRAMQNSSPASV